MGDFKTCGGCFHYLMVCISSDKWQSINTGDCSLQKLVIRKFSPPFHPPPASFLTLFLSCKISNSDEFHLCKRHDINCFKNWFEKEKELIWTRDTLFTLKSLSHFPLFLDATLFFFLFFMQVIAPLRWADRQMNTHTQSL